MNKEEVCLKEILETLKRIESRLNRGKQLSDGGPVKVKAANRVKHI